MGLFVCFFVFVLVLFWCVFVVCVVFFGGGEHFCSAVTTQFFVN